MQIKVVFLKLPTIFIENRIFFIVFQYFFLGIRSHSPLYRKTRAVFVSEKCSGKKEIEEKAEMYPETKRIKRPGKAKSKCTKSL
ncbi:MAG: hypothetical protein LUF85_09510 [Bacteroides sp.]|nr:hypothetical protein [Bacteroides sp.]